MISSKAKYSAMQTVSSVHTMPAIAGRVAIHFLTDNFAYFRCKRHTYSSDHA